MDFNLAMTRVCILFKIFYENNRMKTWIDSSRFKSRYPVLLRNYFNNMNILTNANDIE